MAFKTRIIRVPHPSFYRVLRNFVFQAPENLPKIDNLDLPDWDYPMVFRQIREEMGLDPSIPYATGVRICDSLTRRAALKRFGPYTESKMCFHTIFDWTIAQTMGAIKANHLKLPVDYELWGRSFDGIDYRFLSGLRDRFPRDFDRVQEFFPLAEVEIKRFEWREKHAVQNRG